MKSYKQNFQDNLNAEIIGFREKIMAQPAQEIYDDAYRIHFYEFMYDYLGSEKFSTAEYKAFLEADKTFIDSLKSNRCVVACGRLYARLCRASRPGLYVR